MAKNDICASQEQHSLSEAHAVHSGAIVRIAFSGDGQRVATASVDHTARAIRVPLCKYHGEGTDFIGHNSGVLHVSWSHDSRKLLTGSSDCSARLWSVGKSDPMIEFVDINGTKPLGAHAPFRSEIRGARFLHMDRFILLSCASKLYLYKYRLAGEEHKGNDIQRLRQTNNNYKLVHTYATDGQSITHFSNINSFISNIALCGVSNRDIEVSPAVGDCEKFWAELRTSRAVKGTRFGGK
mgnify:CR=1 FL=1